MKKPETDLIPQASIESRIVIVRGKKEGSYSMSRKNVLHNPFESLEKIEYLVFQAGGLKNTIQ